MKPPRILITSGEPAGIGPDIVIQAAQEQWPAELVVIGDPKLLMERASTLSLPLKLESLNNELPPKLNPSSFLKIIPVSLQASCIPGQLSTTNTAYVIETLKIAAEQALANAYPIVTAPVHKGVLNEAGFAFSGHTEFFAAQEKISQVVMLFVVRQNNVKVALTTTHLPLAKVSSAITTEKIISVARILNKGLIDLFKIPQPKILACGLNPHAGENGHLGHEEIGVITPALEQLRKEGLNINGPLPADTIFTEKYLKQADAILAMYHDQALPAVKLMGFGNAVNITLGLPYIRTSVDHGTALDVAGTGKADASSLREAIHTAMELVLHH